MPTVSHEIPENVRLAPNWSASSVDYVLPVSFAVAIWWLSTVVLIYRTGMPRASYPATLGAATIVALAGIWAIVASRSAVTDAAMYAGFAGAIAVWGWHEVTYLFGFVSGPRPAACPPSCTGWRRFAFGLRACAYHEFLVVATAGVLTLLTWGHPNRISLCAFVILWLMRWSAKLNIFLGVRNLHSEYWPEHLAYLKSFTRQRAMNPLFPCPWSGPSPDCGSSDRSLRPPGRSLRFARDPCCS